MESTHVERSFVAIFPAVQNSPFSQADAQYIALAVSEPGGSLSDTAATRVVAFHLRNAINGLKSGQVIFVENHSTPSQFRDHCLEVIDLPRHLSVGSRWPA